MSDCPKCGVLNDCTCWMRYGSFGSMTRENAFIIELQQRCARQKADIREIKAELALYKLNMKEPVLQAELTELRAFKAKVMGLEPLGCVCRCETGYENSIVKEDLDSYLSMSVPIYDLKGIKDVDQ